MPRIVGNTFSLDSGNTFSFPTFIGGFVVGLFVAMLVAQQRDLFLPAYSSTILRSFSEDKYEASRFHHVESEATTSLSTFLPSPLPPSLSPSLPQTPSPTLIPYPSHSSSPSPELFSHVVDGVKGGQVLRAWLPRRSTALLPLPQFDSSSVGATLVIDNFFHLYQRSISTKLFSWPPRALKNPLFGLVEAPLGLSAEGLAPPLPKCTDLENGLLRHPTALQPKSSYKNYLSGARVVETGGDDFAASLSRLHNVSTSLADPYSIVRSLLWHRISSVDREIFGKEFFNGTEAYAKPRMSEDGRTRFCARRGDYSKDFEPSPPCPTVVDFGSTGGAPEKWPYCNPPTSPIAVISFDCGIVESYFSDVVVFNMITLDGGGHVLSSNVNNWGFPSVPIQEFDELACTGNAVYPTAPGHFFNEILPRLVVLDFLLPQHIPLLWPSGAMTEQVLADFRAAGILSSERPYPLLQTNSAPQVMRARRLFSFASTVEMSSWSPLILMLAQRVMAASIHEAVLARQTTNQIVSKSIVVLTRAAGQSRSIINEAALLEALRASFPSYTIDAFVPNLPFLDVAQRVFKAKLIIGPHGANLNNMFGAQPSTAIIEIGYAGGMRMPSDYFCLARNLGLRYWLSPSATGEYGTPMVAHIDDIVKIAKEVLS